MNINASIIDQRVSGMALKTIRNGCQKGMTLIKRSRQPLYFCACQHALK